MHYIQDGANSLNLIIKLNWDRLMFLAALAAGLYLGSFLGTL